MIRRLRRKFIIASMFSLALVLLVILGGVNLMSYRKLTADADAVLAVLAQGGGSFSKPEDEQLTLPESGASPQPGGEKKPLDGHPLSPETPYESRFFWVLLDEAGQVLETDTGQIVSIDAQSAAAYAQAVAESGRSSGFADNFRFLVCQEQDGVRLIFLDCRSSLSSFYMTLLASLGLSLLGLGCVLVLLLILSGRIIRPVAEAYEKQRQFITDAGHELKTPLTIIQADTDLTEMECGENQWLTDIRRQALRLTGLTNDLICLSRLEEEGVRLPSIEFPLSDVAEEMAHSFLAPARQQGKELSIRVQPMLSYTGDEKSIRQLISILLDNALKYSPSGAQLRLELEKQGRSLLLTVANTTAQPVDREQLSRLFDRFYRADASRSSQTGGYGLGLSIARSIVLAHKGKIRAESPEDRCLVIQVWLPL